MLNRFSVALAALFVLASSAHGAGTIPGFSLAQQQDSNGTPLVGCKLYTIQAGTTSTPQIAYQDSGLTLPLSYPVVCDAYGRLPQIFLADGSIKLRLTKSNGTQVFVLDGVLVVGASSGGGGGSPVDATTVLATGDLKVKYGTGVLSGFVRANGRTVGSATSGATERANSDTQTLFEYLWNADANLSVSTGRGVSSAADWAANKTIALPDWRGRALAGLDDMGNTAAGVLTTAIYGADPTVLGQPGGAQSVTMAQANMPNVTLGLTGILSVTSSAGVVTATNGTPFANAGFTTGAGGPVQFLNGQSNTAGAVTSTGNLASNCSPSCATASINGSTTQTAMNKLSPLRLATIYIKL